ncbi:MAG: crossover junction endodeoxyribonuclease RuvC [Deltaproteobacteria bacterium RIFOXYD12_FULL_57_12]|nr:MAG: crossover junction endodeoxyribonuclease RuvC [Deltaproteobacteria bacterium RIFOXYD12_FULL_57_12]
MVTSGGCLRILGIDPGSRVTGYGVIEKSGGRLSLVSCGVIKMQAQLSMPERLQVIYNGLSEVIRSEAPAVAAVEDVFVAVNPRSALKLGHARGAAVLAAVQHGLAVFDYTPRLVKQAVVGYGQADKGQIQQMVRVLLRLSASPSADAADALAVAICHANRSVLP